MFTRAASLALSIPLLLIPPAGGPRGPAATADGGTLVLRNARWDRVQVEARLGAATDCAANRALGTRALRRGQAWTFVTRTPVCWRRERVPGDVTQGWEEWTRVQVADGAKREVDL